MLIKVKYSSIDRYSERRSFKSVQGARRYAQKWVGKNPDCAPHYAISDDGVGKIEVSGISLKELFGQVDIDLGQDPNEMFMRSEADLMSDYPPPEAYEFKSHRDVGCVCSHEQLVHVGCDCGADCGEPLPRPKWDHKPYRLADDWMPF